MSGVVDVLVDLARALEPLRVRWMLIGAQAVTRWGGVRATEDIDVAVECELRGGRAMLARVSEAGFAHRYPDIVEELLEGGAVFPLRHVASGFEVDLVLANSGLEALALSRVVEWLVAGARVPVAHPTDLVVMKILAGRGKDLEDVAALLATGKVDATEVRDLLGQLEEALAQSDLLPRFEAALRKGR